MSTTQTKETAIPPDVIAELQEAADWAAKGIRDPEKTRLACERMDRLREEILQKARHS